VGWSVGCVKTLLSHLTHVGDAVAEMVILTVFSVTAVLEKSLKDAGNVTKLRAKTDTLTHLTKRGQDSAEGSSNASKRLVPKSFLSSLNPRWEEQLSMAIFGLKKNEKLLNYCLMAKKKHIVD
jgi:high-affinity K+ transport system ATPase subunit B